MRQRVAHGAQLDVATPDEVRRAVHEELAARAESVNAHRHREKGVIPLDAAGTGARAVDVSPQFNWKTERVTVGGAGAVNALFLMYENDSGSDTGLLEVIGLGTAGRYSDAFSNNLWIPAGTRIVIVVTGGIASREVTFNFQVELVPSASR